MRGFPLANTGTGEEDASTETPYLAEGTPVALWLLAVVIAIIGVVQLLQGQILFAIVLFIIAALVGPGGYSIFSGRRGRTV
jgi:hypothetical protein